MTGPDLAPPRSPRTPAPERGGAQWYGWLFMRVSGLVLIILVLGHVFVTSIPGEGVQQVNFAYVAGRWSSVWLRLWDGLMLWLAEIHGVVGLRTVIDDYARRPGTRVILTALLYLSAVLILVLGTYVIATFNPNLST